MRELKEKRDEVEMERELERTTRERDMERAGLDRRSTPRVFEKGRVLLPNIVGMSYGVPSGLGGLAVFGASGPVSFSFGSSSQYAYSHLAFTPSVDVLVGERLTLGGTVGLSRTTQRTEMGQSIGGVISPSRSTGTSTFAQPRIGYLQPLGRGVYLWPRLALRAGGTWSEVNDASQVKALDLGVELDAPIVFPLSRWVFLQASPVASYSRSSGSNASLGDSDADGFSFGSYVRLGLAL